MIAKEKVTKEDLIAQAPEGLFIKLVVDIEKEIFAFGCELHFDCYKELLEAGSRHKNLWGANFYSGKNVVDFVSLINIRPPTNRSMEIKDEKIRDRVEAVIKRLIVSSS